MYLGKPITFLADTPYIQREEETKNILEHLGAYQLIEKHFEAERESERVPTLWERDTAKCRFVNGSSISIKK